MHCVKRLGKRVMALRFEHQATGLHVRVALGNRLTQLGRVTKAAEPAMA